MAVVCNIKMFKLQKLCALNTYTGVQSQKVVSAYFTS